MQEALILCEYATLNGGERSMLATLDGVTRTAQEDGQTVLYSRDVPDTIAALLAAADGLSVEPRNLGIRHATLEDVFLDLTGRALRD